MVKICKFSMYHKELTATLEENNIEYSDEECLGRCDLCHSKAYVKSAEEFIYADNVEELIKKIVS